MVYCECSVVQNERRTTHAFCVCSLRACNSAHLRRVLWTRDFRGTVAEKRHRRFEFHCFRQDLRCHWWGAMACVLFRFSLTMHFDWFIVCGTATRPHIHLAVCWERPHGKLLSTWGQLARQPSSWGGLPLKRLLLCSVKYLLILGSWLNRFSLGASACRRELSSASGVGSSAPSSHAGLWPAAVGTAGIGRSQLELGCKTEFLKVHWKFYIDGRLPLHNLKSYYALPL